MSDENNVFGIRCPCCHGGAESLVSSVILFKCGTRIDTSLEYGVSQSENCGRIANAVRSAEEERDRANRQACAHIVSMIPHGVCKDLIQYDQRDVYNAIQNRAWTA